MRGCVIWRAIDMTRDALVAVALGAVARALAYALVRLALHLLTC